MKPVRIIPRLDIKGPNLVKGIHLEGLRVLGKPSEFASYYYEEGADELLFMDVVASLYERNSLHEIISETAKKNFIPITVGGSGCGLVGDTNGDSTLNVLDVVLLVNIILDANASGDDCSDVNGDGAFNVLDVVLLVNLILNP